jgi:amicyanin
MMMDQTARVYATGKPEGARWMRAGLLVAVAVLTLGVAPWLGGHASAAPLSVHAASYAPSAPKPGKKAVHRPGDAMKPQVKIANFKFGPRALTVKVGTKVTWTNNDAIAHSVNFAAGNINSKALGQGATFSHTFIAAGTYPYICDIHPFMHGTIVVTA